MAMALLHVKTSDLRSGSRKFKLQHFMATFDPVMLPNQQKIFSYSESEKLVNNVKMKYDWTNRTSKHVIVILDVIFDDLLLSSTFSKVLNQIC